MPRLDPDLPWLLALIAQTEDLTLRDSGPAPSDTSELRRLGVDSIGRVCLLYAVLDALDAPDVDEAVCASWQTLGDVVTFARQQAAR